MSLWTQHIFCKCVPRTSLWPTIYVKDTCASTSSSNRDVHKQLSPSHRFAYCLCFPFHILYMYPAKNVFFSMLVQPALNAIYGELNELRMRAAAQEKSLSHYRYRPSVLRSRMRASHADSGFDFMPQSVPIPL